MQQAGTAVFRVDDMEFGRRLAVERELEKVGGGIGTTAWDETGGFLLYPTMLGIKGESDPFVHLADRVRLMETIPFAHDQSSTRCRTEWSACWARTRRRGG